MSAHTMDELIDLYVQRYPHLAALAARRDDPRSRKALGDQIGRLAYPPSVTGAEALLLSEIGTRAGA